MKNLAVQQNQQQQQFLWRPAQEVLHFLTENSTKPRLPQAPFLPNGDVNLIEADAGRDAGQDTGRDAGVTTSNRGRQAPSVWKPPSAMKAIIPPPPVPMNGPVRESQGDGEQRLDGEQGVPNDGNHGDAGDGRDASQSQGYHRGEQQGYHRGEQQQGYHREEVLMPPPPAKSKDHLDGTPWLHQSGFHYDGNTGGNHFFHHQPPPVPQVQYQEYIFLKQHNYPPPPPPPLIEEIGVPKPLLFSPSNLPTLAFTSDVPRPVQLMQVPHRTLPFTPNVPPLLQLPSVPPSIPNKTLAFTPPTLQLPSVSIPADAPPSSVSIPSTTLAFTSDVPPSLVPPGKLPIPAMVPPFVKPAVPHTPLFTGLGTQQIAQTPLFSGLGTVSFTSENAPSQPQQPAASIFAQSAGFGVGASKISTSSSGHQQQPQGKLSSTNSASEKGSSNSDHAGFRRSELQGKSLLNGEHSPTTKPASSSKVSDAAKAGGSGGGATTTTTRKLRTRPMEVLIKATDPKPAAEQTPATRAGKKAKQAADLPPVAPRRRKQLQQAETTGEKQGAFFAHTGAWIAQKTSARRAKNKFKQREAENVVISTRSAGKKRSLAAMNNEKPTKKMSLEKVDRKLGMNQHQQQQQENQPEKRSSSRLEKKRVEKVVEKRRVVEREKRVLLHDKRPVDRKLDKVRSIHETMRVVASTPEDQDLDDEDEEEEDGGEAEVEEDEEEGRRGKPLIRSKRGRSQSLPNRLRDSVVNKVKKRSRK